MFPLQKITLHSSSSHNFINSRKILWTIHIIIFIASLLANVSYQDNVTVALNKTTPSSPPETIGGDTGHEPPPPLFLINNNERQSQRERQRRNLTRVYFDNHVAGYISNEIPPNISWPFEFASNVWKYAKETYGPYGLDPHIYVLLNTGNWISEVSSFYATHLDAQYNFKNVAKVGKQSGMGWTEGVNKTAELLTLTSLIGNIVQFSSKNTKGFPGYETYDDPTDGSSAWNIIFAYDIFSKFGMPHQDVAESFLAEALNPFWTTRSSDVDSDEEIERVNWVKDWFWPIYSKYDGSLVLDKFLDNSYLYFPRELENRTDPPDSSVGSYFEFGSYTRKMWKGEFVHFWSGSAGEDLRDLAENTFSWSGSDEEDFQRARVSFPKLNYQCDGDCDDFLLPKQLAAANNVDKGQNRPKITVESEKTTYMDEVIRKTVNENYLYRPLNKSERYLYDGENELHVVQTQVNVCYYITCSAPYIIKWTTTIPLKNIPVSSSLERCGAGKYLNSRRLQDPPHSHNKNEEAADSNSNGNGNDIDNGNDNKRHHPMYKIQFIFGNFESNMGLLKCESIENSTMSTHFYFTEATGVDTLSIVSYAPSSATLLDSSFFLNAELFLDNDLDRKLIVPCRGTSLKVQLDLSLRLHPAWKYDSQIKIWDKNYGNLDSESVEYNVTYDPVLGFTFTYDIPPFKEMPLFTVASQASLGFWCGAKDGGTMRYNVYITSGLNETKGHLSKITIVDDEFEISSESNGCFFVKNSDRFLFFGSRNELNAQDGHYPLKLINCNSPDECDVYRQCLDFEHKFCYSEQAQLQADMFKLVKPHNRGLLRCFDYNGEIGYKPIYEYTFVGLDRIRYVLSEDIPTKAIIYLDETPSTLLTNVPATFRCQIASFILVANIRFALVFSNKTIQLQSSKNIQKSQPSGQSISLPPQSIEMYDTNDVSSVLNANADLGIGWENIHLNLTADVVGVMCFAPLHNSTEWVNVTRSFKAKDIQKPIIKKGGGINSRRVFGKGENDFKLHCESSGAPYPEIKWKLPNTNLVLNNNLFKVTLVEASRKNLTLSEITDEIGNSILNFPPMEQFFVGTYTCIASNLYGNDSYDFMLDYQESGLGWRENTGIGFAVVFFISLLTSFFVLFFKYRNTSRKLRDLTEEEISEFKNGKKSGNKGENYYLKIKAEGKIDISLLPFDKKLILDPRDLMIEKGIILGKGNFGIVYRGLLNGCPVAVKTLKSTADVSFVKSLLSELKIMSFIGDHEHIIQFYGAVIEKIQKRAVEAVVELSPFGNLKNYLKNILASFSSVESRFINLLVNDVIVHTHSPTSTATAAQGSKDKITTLTLVDWCRQIASGMNFLALKRVYHGDLAARNILVFKNQILKITDFGLSKQLYSSASYVKKEKIALPWRWMALETLNFQEFSIESDVWAFGVTIWEIFSLGKFPYPGLNWTPEFITILSSGMRMGKPEYCSKSIHDEMLKCWSEKPMDRPNFAYLVDLFQRILEENQQLSSTEEVLLKKQAMANEEVNDLNYSNHVVYSLF